ncbi:hypothetical protein J9341_06280 [Enterococcus faecalis]|nr:hypothetical protein [Enterococcus faecalis]HAP4426598.1 hypothetical protein [Enterococcus faecalis]HAP4770484.1 hypothetical protein [Enterococcus faecalis]HAP5175082.1 hypothetical protein [Enterococcus faecalis]HCR4111882.1 hypothetical protein [Enterococcus faecalis]
MLESAQTIALPAKVTILGCFSRKSENLSKTLGLKSLVSTILISSLPTCCSSGGKASIYSFNSSRELFQLFVTVLLFPNVAPL